MGTQLPSPKRGQSPPIFGKYLLWPNGWMDQHATGKGGRPQPKRRCVRWGPSSPPPKEGGAPQLSAHVYCGLDAWIDQDVAWHGGRSRPRPHCARWGPTSPSPKGAQPQFSAHICCGQMAGWIKIPLGREVGLIPSDIVLDGNPAPPPLRRGRSPPIFGPGLLWPHGWMDEGVTWYGRRPQPRPHCVR